MRLGVLTGGGDCPGLNAVLRGLVRRGVNELGYEFVGIQNGYDGLILPDLTMPLGLAQVRGILPKGGTILGTSNKADPFNYVMKEGGKTITKDMSDVVLKRIKALKLDGLVCIGGDGTLTMAHKLAERGVKIVACPKTIDNDLSGTDQTFGFDTAVNVISEAIDRLHSTAEAHQRVMVVEIMGRNAGFLTLEGGIAGGADFILIPELPYDVEKIVAHLLEIYETRKKFAIVAISEGAFPRGGAQAVQAKADEIPGRGVVRLGGSGKVLADLLAPHLEAEIRVTVLGHLQRGGSPSPMDRVLATMYGAMVLDLVRDGKWDHMVCLRDGKLGFSPLAESRKERQVDPHGDKVRLAKSIGISFGV
ncbi:MAG: ATP-dependent 6-phosphofructokinase [Archangium sp.]|nr:ATP-dependent 6-phosphofructokinase [Archangium sp.]